MSILEFFFDSFKRKKAIPKLDSLEWMFPPKNPHSADEWNKYWDDQLKHGGMVPALADMLIDDKFIVETAQRFGLKTVLCVGNGLSQEPVALSKAGLKVTAMDISPFAVYVAKEIAKDFDSPDKFFDIAFVREGGRVDFLEGDLFNLDHCPGPYDIVIERRTVQDYPPKKHRDALKCILARLAKKGILICHCHDGGWRLGEERKHPTRSVLEELGILLWNYKELQTLDGQLAITEISTG